MTTAELDETFTLRDLSRGELMERLGASESDVHPGVAYQGLQPVDRLDAPGHPGHFYFQGDRLRMIYLPRAATAGLSVDDLRAGEPAARLRSRAGKRSSIEVYPERGVAFSRQGDKLEFAEVFPPTTLERYRDEIYREPPAFKR